MDDELKNQIRTLSDEDLLNMIDRDSDDYDPDVLEAARKEAEARGGIDHLYETVEAQLGSEEHLDGAFAVGDAETATDHSHELVGRLFSNVRTLRDEAISEINYFFIRGAAGHAEKVLENIQKKLEAANIPLRCRWGVTEVKTKGWISRVRRNFLIVEVDEFRDYHCYISVRDFGIYLDCVRLLTIEPGLVKKFLAKKFTGDEEALSRPKNILKHQDLHSWNEAVTDCFRLAIEELIAELQQPPTCVRKGEKTLLEIW